LTERAPQASGFNHEEDAAASLKIQKQAREPVAEVLPTLEQ